MWNSRKAWALVLSGVILVGVVNVLLAWRDLPAGFDENWSYADAAVPATTPAPAPAPTTSLDAGVSDSR